MGRALRSDISRRIERLEQEAGIRPPPIVEIHIIGGLAPGVASIASFGTHEWEAAPGETFEAFRARARAAAEAEGLAHIVFGGVPGPELIASGYLECHHPELCDSPSMPGCAVVSATDENELGIALTSAVLGWVSSIQPSQSLSTNARYAD